ncbi:hypothetical protein GZ77_13510 [Endozoicomonas montiporae]|uniref:ChrR-like cupin domain-containing protein n=2 Tax=Endozoicomonas montiporae TaxID=1027273 RepID=A0A081N4M8_9GAMM|nr:ChrR family anti-sigma-E factor [Endozoicomonas montiporae]AMO57722.1 anti-ECF sigma factor [Endozoicomonas montiporae CL-33]KEQ13401.1 hypothetical protein GZ77_13510 [Endozoicomonas montiporae]
MTAIHHPDPSSLMSYAAGSLPESIAMVIACHLSSCEHCRKAVSDAEDVGRTLLEQLEPVTMSDGARDNMLAMLDNVAPEPFQSSPVKAVGNVPAPLQPMLGEDLNKLHWRTMAPGMKQFIIPAPEGKLRLLKIAPGTSMPKHSHTGSELTLVLQGSYSDELGRFRAGDIADLDGDISHQPMVDTHEDCICLIATDAPLKFTGLIPRLLQPFFDL